MVDLFFSLGYLNLYSATQLPTYEMTYRQGDSFQYCLKCKRLQAAHTAISRSWLYKLWHIHKMKYLCRYFKNWRCPLYIQMSRSPGHFGTWKTLCKTMLSSRMVTHPWYWAQALWCGAASGIMCYISRLSFLRHHGFPPVPCWKHEKGMSQTAATLLAWVPESLPPARARAGAGAQKPISQVSEKESGLWKFWACLYLYRII